MATVVAIVAFSLPALGQDWLTNGDFESGTSGWVRVEAAPGECPAQAGNQALGLSIPGPTTGRVSRNVFGPLPSAEYTLTGWTQVTTGATVRVRLSFSHAFGDQSGITVPVGIQSGQQYTPFTVTAAAKAEADSATISFELVSDGPATLCIDSLRLVSEDEPPTAVPTSTATPVPGSSATPTPTASPLPATSSATPPASSSTTPSATASPQASATATVTATSGPSFVFTNGGLEQGLVGWSKYGGTLTTTSDALSGSTAGLLISETDSTKWAYQAVHIDPSQYYEFSGSVGADAGVREAYLRISWYPTTDASGSALSTADSLQRAGPGGYTFLTTGPVKPPPEAVSARVRIVLAPLGAEPASISFDDVWFGTAAAPTPTPVPSTTPVPSASPSPESSGTPTPSATFALLGSGTSAPPTSDDPLEGAAEPEAEPAAALVSDAQAASGGTSASVTSRASASPTPILIAEVASTRAEARASASGEQTGQPLTASASREDEGLAWPWLLGIGLLIGGLGGIYWQKKHKAA